MGLTVMIDFTKNYSSKLLLFGEYTVLDGSKALSIPFSKYAAQWERTKLTDHRLIPFFEYILKTDFSMFPEISLKKEFLLKSIEDGLSFKSTIRTGYGLGSSGALSAASLDVFFNKKEMSLEQTKSILAKLESFFHGKSSGIDALTIYENKAIVIKEEGKITSIEKIQIPKGLFLLDTLIERNTASLVEHYYKQISGNDLIQKSISSLVNAVDKSIDLSIEGPASRIYDHFREISKIQLRTFDRMIPDQQKIIWQKGIETDEYLLKLLGAGGGGYLLGLAKNVENLNQLEHVQLINHL